MNFENIERRDEEDLAAKVFDNSYFGYYKVTIERPARLKAQFTEERITGLRFDKSLTEPMEWAYETYGEKVYWDLKSVSKELLDWCEKNDLNLNAKKRKALTSAKTWQKQKELLETATRLMVVIGTEEHSDYNVFLKLVNKTLKDQGIKHSASERNQILGAVSWYDETSEKIIKKTQKFNDKKLGELLNHLGYTVEQLPHFGYYPVGQRAAGQSGGGRYITYETQTDLRDTESVPLEESIQDYFLREVKPPCL